MSAGRRSHGTGHIHKKHGAYYARWRTSAGRLLNRRIGPVRAPGTRDGLTRGEAERRFRQMQQEEEARPTVVGERSVSVSDAGDSLRRESLIWSAAVRCRRFT
jgi:hypothetical protein